MNVALFHENPNPKEYISLVPTSAHSGDGMGNLIALICELSQSHLAKRVAYSPLLQATVMEVKAIPGLGTTIDVILVNGWLEEGQTIIVPGSEGPIVTQIRGLLMPQPMKELRVKGAYDHVKRLDAAQGVKIIGKDLEKALAGLPLHVAYHQDEVDIYRVRLTAAVFLPQLALSASQSIELRAGISCVSHSCAMCAGVFLVGFLAKAYAKMSCVLCLLLSSFRCFTGRAGGGAGGYSQVD